MENKKTKIIYILTKGSPYGGAQKYVYTLATILAPEQFETIVLVGAGEELPKKLEEKNIRVIRVPEMGRDIDFKSDLKSFWQLVTILKKENPDIIHINSSKAGGLGALAGRVAGVSKIVFTAHGWAFNEKRSRHSLWIIKFISWITILLCHNIIVISKSEEVQTVTMPFAQHKVSLVYNGIEPIDFLSKNDARTVLNEKISAVIDPQKVWIGSIAELHPNKNISATISAFSKIQEKTVLVIIGEGEERQKLEQQIQESGLGDKVFLVGKIEHAGRLLKAFDIFVLPSLKEGLPYTLLEAGLAELPCLSSYVGGIPEIIRNNISGTLVEPTKEGVHEGLEFLINNPDKAKEFGQTLKEKVEKDFSIEKMIAETIGVYML